MTELCSDLADGWSPILRVVDRSQIQCRSRQHDSGFFSGHNNNTLLQNFVHCAWREQSEKKKK